MELEIRCLRGRFHARASPLEDSKAPPSDSGSAHANPKLDVPPEKVLGSKHVYTLHVNMPNLTSASGSWVLNFAELDEMECGRISEIRGVRSVRGRFHCGRWIRSIRPSFALQHVEGEVVLYAVIRKDGTRGQHSIGARRGPAS